MSRKQSINPKAELNKRVNLFKELEEIEESTGNDIVYIDKNTEDNMPEKYHKTVDDGFMPGVSKKTVIRTTVKEEIKNRQIEDDMFEKYYKMPVDGFRHINHKKSEVLEQHKTFDEGYFKPMEPFDDGFRQSVSKKTMIRTMVKEEIKNAVCVTKSFDKEMLNDDMEKYYRVLVHHNKDSTWDYESYHKITTIKKWSDISKVFNTLNKVFGETNYTDYDIFIMKNEIYPMWEDIENRSGSICSIKIDSLDIGYSIFKTMLIYSANNTLMKFSLSEWDVVNGLSFTTKKIEGSGEDMCYVIIKIWFKKNYSNTSTLETYLNPDVLSMIKKYSVKVRPIKPEY